MDSQSINKLEDACPDIGTSTFTFTIHFIIYTIHITIRKQRRHRENNSSSSQFVQH